MHTPATHLPAALTDAQEAALERVARLAATLLDASAGLVWLSPVDASTDPVCVRFPASRVQPCATSTVEHRCREVVASAQPLILPRESYRNGRASAKNGHERGFVGVPLLGSNSAVLGCLCALDFKEALTEDAVTALQDLAALAVGVLEAAQDAPQVPAAADWMLNAQRQAQELELLNQARTAVARELDLSLVIRRVVEAVADIFGYRLVSIYLLDGDALHLQHQVGYTQWISKMPLNRGVMGYVARTGDPVLLEDVQTSPLFIGAFDGIDSEVCVPLLDQGRTVGVLNVETTEGIRLSEADLRLMVALSEHVSVAIERARLYTEVRERESQYGSVVNNIKEVIFQTDAEGHWTFLNPAWEEITGYTREESIGKTSYDFVHPADRNDVMRAFRALRRFANGVYHFELRFVRKDGTARWVEVFASSTLHADGTLSGSTGVLNDIGKRKATEEALQRQLRETLLLNRVIAAAASELDPNAIMTIICEELALAFNLPQAAFGALDAGHTKVTVVAEYVGEGRPSALGVEIPVVGNPATQHVLEHRAPLVVADSQHDQRQAVIHEMQRQRGTASLLIVPVMIRDEVIGTLGLDSAEYREFTAEEVALAQNVANAASQVLEKARLYTAVQQELAERKRAEEALRQQNEYLAALHETSLGLMNRLHVGGLLEAILTRAAQLAGAANGYIYLVELDKDAMRMAVGLGAASDLLGYQLKRGESISGKVWETGMPQIVNDYREWPGRFAAFSHKPFHAAVAVPLFSEGEVVGTIGLSYDEPGRTFRAEELELLEKFAQLASIALDNARLYSSVQQELSERKRAEAALRISEERYVLAARGANDGLWDWNLETGEVYYSPRWKTMLGFEEHEMGDTADEWFSRVHPEDLPGLQAELEAHLREETPQLDAEYRILHKSRVYRWMRSRAVAVRNSDGIAYRMAGSQTDVTARKQAEKQLLHDAFHDALTGLPNRTLFMDQLERAIERARRREEYRFAVLFLDLDRFKIVNDSLGHIVGDELLIMIARKLEACVRPMDMVVRLGGDEFTILLDSITQEEDATIIADRIQQELALPFSVAGQEVFMSVSIGIVLSDMGYEQPVDILRDADIAMYHAKGLGKARYMVFDVAMHAQAVELLQMETALRRAVEREEFRLAYQPIVSLESGCLKGFEALLRWRHAERGDVAPALFVPITEETGLIVPIGRWVLRQACRQMKAWQAQFPTDAPLAISVNLSSKQLAQPGLVETVAEALRDTGLDPRTLRLEITESAMMENTESAIEILNQLKAMGIQIYMDDFGSGYSSLAYLHRFPIDTLKIDRSFVSKLGADQEGTEIIQTIVTLARSLGIDMVAEGIETVEQLSQLRALGCEYGQGYLFAKPLAAEDAEALLAEQRCW